MSIPPISTFWSRGAWRSPTPGIFDVSGPTYDIGLANEVIAHSEICKREYAETMASMIDLDERLWTDDNPTLRAELRLEAAVLIQIAEAHLDDVSKLGQLKLPEEVEAWIVGLTRYADALLESARIQQAFFGAILDDRFEDAEIQADRFADTLEVIRASRSDADATFAKDLEGRSFKATGRALRPFHIPSLADSTSCLE